MAEAVTEHLEMIAAEVLATTTTKADDTAGLGFSDEELGFAFSVAKV